MTLSTRNIHAAALSVAFAGLTICAIFWRPTPVDAQSASTPAPASAEFYTQEVQPIFQANCYRCHGGMNHRGGLHLDAPASILLGGKDGAVIVPGHPEESLLIKLIRHEGPPDDPRPMPPRGKISDADIATITQWIQAGAIMPTAPATSTSK